MATLVNEYQHPGKYSVLYNVKTLHGASLPSGIYFYKLHAGDYISVKKMIYLK
ncbi:MAG: hypothetical protein AB1521_11745 [Bacteroidota bacterium]